MSCENCCSEPPCPAPTLQCKSIAASKSKAPPCGFLNEGLRWLIRTTVNMYGMTSTSTYTVNLDGSCSLNTTCDSGATLVETQISEYSGEGYYCILKFEWFAGFTPGCGLTFWVIGTSSMSSEYGSCEASMDSRVSNFWNGTYTDSEGNTSPMETGGACSPCGDPVFWALPTTPENITYSSENPSETTGAMISRTVAALPGFPAWPEDRDPDFVFLSGQGETCSAFKNLSLDESSYSIRRTKYRIAHSPTGTCYLKVWLQSRFTPEGGGADIITPLPAYTWSLTGNPCFPDDTKSPGHVDNLIFGDEAEEQEPSEDGTTTIEIVKYSCLPGYEPGEGEPDGFPPAPAE